jgi:hypothetical protein
VYVLPNHSPIEVGVFACDSHLPWWVGWFVFLPVRLIDASFIAVGSFCVPFFSRGVNGSSLFSDVTQRRLLVTDLSGQPIGPVFMGQAVQERLLRLLHP